MVGSPVPLVSERDQGVHTRLGLDDDTASVTPISPARSTARDVFFTSESHTAVSASTGDDFDFDTVDKHGFPSCGC
jgi:hypothetical protein